MKNPKNQGFMNEKEKNTMKNNGSSYNPKEKSTQPQEKKPSWSPQSSNQQKMNSSKGKDFTQRNGTINKDKMCRENDKKCDDACKPRK